MCPKEILFLVSFSEIKKKKKFLLVLYKPSELVDHRTSVLSATFELSHQNLKKVTS